MWYGSKKEKRKCFNYNDILVCLTVNNRRIIIRHKEDFFFLLLNGTEFIPQRFRSRPLLINCICYREISEPWCVPESGCSFSEIDVMSELANESKPKHIVEASQTRFLFLPILLTHAWPIKGETRGGWSARALGARPLHLPNWIAF